MLARDPHVRSVELYSAGHLYADWTGLTTIFNRNISKR